MANAVAVTERATNDLLSAPDWAINIELCDIINADPRQAKDALKTIKKKLGNKNPKMQILALSVLDALSKNCGEQIFQQMVEGDIVRKMVKIVKKKPDLSVREKILVLIDTWQAALGGIEGKFPQYYAAYNELKSAGVEFPPQEENTVPLFTPPPTHPLSHSTFPYEDEVDFHDLETDASGLSLEEIKNAEGLVDVLTEMLAALDPNNSQGVKDELIVDLVDQCRAYQKRVTVLVNNTVDEGLLCGGLLLYDRLQRVLRMHENIASGTAPEVSVAIIEDSVAGLSLSMNVNHEDEESDDDSSKLKHRSSKDTSLGLVLKPAAAKIRPKQTDLIPTRKNPFSFDTVLTSIHGPEKAEKPSITSGSTSTRVPPHSSPPAADVQAVPMVKNQLNGAPRGVPAAGNLPPPPSKYNQRQQFFEQHITGGSSKHSASSSLSFKSTNTEKEKPQVSMYKAIIDLTNAKAATAKPMRSS
ncbi:hypothetical protein ACS0TY_036769 [Phlomoides rotata]